MSNTCKNFQNPKIAVNLNDSEWPEMDSTHNLKNCNIFFNEGKLHIQGVRK